MMYNLSHRDKKEGLTMYPYTVFWDMTIYDICLVIAVVTALFLADRMGIQRGFSVKLQKVVIIALVEAVVVGFIGAILFQAVYDWIKTGEFVLSKTTGMTFYGGLIFGIIGFLVAWFVIGKLICKSDEPVQKFGQIADITACIIPLAHGIGRIGCFTAGCCHGKPTDAWYGVTMWTGPETQWMKVVPTQLFEALFLFALSAVLFYFFYKKFDKEGAKRVPLLSIYVMAYGVWRFFIEYFRADDRGQTIVPFLSPSQLVAIVMVLLGVAYLVLWYLQKQGKFAPKQAEVIETPPTQTPPEESEDIS